MKCCRVQVYIAGKQEGKLGQVRVAMSFQMALEEEELVRGRYEWVWPLTGPISLYQGFLLVQKLQQQPWITGLESVSLEELEGWQSKVRRWLKKQKWLRAQGVELLPDAGPRMVCGSVPLLGMEDNRFQRQILALLRGRSLFLAEIEQGIREMELISGKREQIQSELIGMLIRGQVELVPAILPQVGCQRCGEKELELSRCGICGEVAWYCPQCQGMGEALSCRPLFRRPDRARLGKEERLPLEIQYTFSLSEYQRKLSQSLVKGLTREAQSKDWLLWAVCGAGKTETTFEVIGEVLRRGGRVLFTSPRREVVRQMVERFQQAFPSVSLVGIYGSSEDKFTQGQLTVATVHQLARFYVAFDLIIFDEVDAFPYKGDPRLKALVERSRKPDGQIIYLSATPDSELLAAAEHGRLEILTLPARFHGKGVPVPELLRHNLPQVPRVQKMPRRIIQWIEESIYRDLAQVFIFLPTRQMVEEFGKSLGKVFAHKGLDDWVEHTHSQDAERSTKVEGFLRGDYPILVSSTIMERGVTVPKANVLVLYADYDRVFNHQSLIQMAGRAGRSQWAPDGQVWFVGKKMSKEMQQAREWIVRMNEEAQQRGLLDEID